MNKHKKIRLKYIADLFNGNSIPDNLKDYYTGRSIPYIPTKELDAVTGKLNYNNGLSVNETDGFRIAPKDSTLMCIEGGSAGKKIGFTDRPVAFVNKLCCFSSKNINQRYLYYSLQSKDFLEQFYLNMSGLIGGVSISILKNLYISLPEETTEQKYIVDILNQKCTQIDALISNQEQQIEKLKQYKQSLITEVVTKGLDKNVPMKDSGIEWIGKIPEHYSIIQMKRLANIVRGGSPRPAGDERYYNGDIPFMKIADITKDDDIYVYSCKSSIKPAGLNNTRIVEANTLLLTNSGATLGIPKITAFKTTFNDGIAAFLDITEKIDILFAYYVLKSKTKYFLDKGSMGMGQPNLNTEIIGDTEIALPPLEEQLIIAKYLREKCSLIDKIITVKQIKINKLIQYKKSLIYEYVTGKKEVS